MLSSDYIAFHHARNLARSGAELMFEHGMVPQTAPTMGLAAEYPEAHITIPAKFEIAEPTSYLLFSTATLERRQLSFLLGFERPTTRVTSLVITDRTRLYDALFKPEQAQVLSSLLWGTGIERASAAQDWAFKFLNPAPALKAPVVEKFNRLVAEWRETRNPIGSVLDICSNFAYQKIVGMGNDAIPLILRELERSIDHWFWALSAITGENPIAEEHRGRLKLMAQDWFAWARQQGYQW